MPIVSGQSCLAFRWWSSVQYWSQFITVFPDLNGKVKKEAKEEIKKLQGNNVTAIATMTPLCGSCYGAESAELKCCNSCEDVKKAYNAKGWALRDFSGIAQCGQKQAEVVPDEGCRVEGTLKVSKISGSFHLVPGLFLFFCLIFLILILVCVS